MLIRAVYALRAITDHGSVANSEEAAAEDEAVLGFELDIDELEKSRTR